MDNYDMSYEIFQGLHKAWEEFKKFCTRDVNTKIFVMPTGVEVGTNNVVCKIYTGLGVAPGALCLLSRGCKLNDDQKETLRSLVKKVRAVSSQLHVETVGLDVSDGK